MGEDFRKVIDSAIKSGNKSEAEGKIKVQEQRDAENARGLTADQVTDLHDNEWDAYVLANAAANNAAGYDNWKENIFKPDYENIAGSRGTGGTGWIALMIRSLFGIRLEQVPRPAGI